MISIKKLSFQKVKFLTVKFRVRFSEKLQLGVHFQKFLIIISLVDMMFDKFLRGP